MVTVDIVEDCAGRDEFTVRSEGNFDRIDSAVAEDLQVIAIGAAREDARGGPLRGSLAVLADKVVAKYAPEKHSRPLGPR